MVKHRSMPKSTLNMTLHFMFFVNLHMIILLMLTYTHYYLTHWDYDIMLRIVIGDIMVLPLPL